MVSKREIDVYKFEELSKDAKETVIERMQEQASEYMDMEFFSEYAKNYIEEKGFEDVEVNYSLGYSQGDGFSFTGTASDNEKFLRNQFGDKFAELATSEYVDDLNISVQRSSSHYSHEKTVSFEVSIYYSDDEDDNYDKETAKLSKLVVELEELGEEWKDDICKQLEKDGYAEIEGNSSRDTILDDIEANDYDFDEEGSVI